VTHCSAAASGTSADGGPAPATVVPRALADGAEAHLARRARARFLVLPAPDGYVRDRELGAARADARVGRVAGLEAGAPLRVVDGARIGRRGRFASFAAGWWGRRILLFPGRRHLSWAFLTDAASPPLGGCGRSATPFPTGGGQAIA
ncbi:MAG: hypothetical protein U5N21_23600, partial [Rhodococcus sp. (in: high G+C Gram-positive bacteria)]|nr:hypothetical protein [Rhodococcus sp. (in: high G+C Gram-positive bacteria)]